MQAEIEPIIVKIKKLLALATSSNENEAQAAMLKAQEMLAKYKLTMKDIQNLKPTQKDVKEKWTPITFKKATWKGRLASVIADNFCCYSYYHTQGTHQVVFFGLTDDIETAAAVFEYAVEYINGRVHQLRQKYYHFGESARGLENDYAQGFIEGLLQKYQEQKQQNQKWALVLVKPQVVVEAHRAIKFRKRLVNTSAKYFGNDYAYHEGQYDGQNFTMISGHIGGQNA